MFHCFAPASVTLSFSEQIDDIVNSERTENKIVSCYFNTLYVLFYDYIFLGLCSLKQVYC